MILRCPECGKEPIAKSDYLCPSCRIQFDTGVCKGSLVVYYGKIYRGHILGCTVDKVWDKERKSIPGNGLGDRGICLKIPNEYSHNTFIWTRETIFRCVGCGNLAINHWEPLKSTTDLCALCLEVPQFEWQKRVGV